MINQDLVDYKAGPSLTYQTTANQKLNSLFNQQQVILPPKLQATETTKQDYVCTRTGTNI